MADVVEMLDVPTIPTEAAVTPVGSRETPTRTVFGLTVLGVALVLGLLGQTLLKAIPWGINLPLWIGTLLLGALYVARRHGAVRGEGRWLAVTAFAFALVLAWRDSDVLVFFAVLAVLGSLILGMSNAQVSSLTRSGIVNYVATLAMSILYTLTQPLELFFSDIRWRELPHNRRSSMVVSVLRGAVIALPLLLVFGVLLVAADALFEKMISDFINFDVDRLVADTVGTLFWAWLVITLLRTAILRRHEAIEVGAPPSLFQLGPIEVGMVLGTLNLLFLAFVAVQSRYFFGGEALLQSNPTLGYAEYARRGFFELVTVATLVIGLLLTLHWMTRPGDARTVKLFRLLSAGMIVLLFVIMASALHRMWLYQREYGLTELRLYTTAFMGWLAFLFVWFARTVLRGERRRFAVGALASAFAALALLVIVNPDALIARVNLARGAVEEGKTDATRTREVDGNYLAGLSAAAVPMLVAQIDTLPTSSRCVVAARLVNRWLEPDNEWRSWNWERWQATRTVNANRTHLRALACPNYNPSMD